jgi:signal transduction histidine kinase
VRTVRKFGSGAQVSRGFIQKIELFYAVIFSTLIILLSMSWVSSLSARKAVTSDAFRRSTQNFKQHLEKDRWNIEKLISNQLELGLRISIQQAAERSGMVLTRLSIIDTESTEERILVFGDDVQSRLFEDVETQIGFRKLKLRVSSENSMPSAMSDIREIMGVRSFSRDLLFVEVLLLASMVLAWMRFVRPNIRLIDRHLISTARLEKALHLRHDLLPALSSIEVLVEELEESDSRCLEVREGVIANVKKLKSIVRNASDGVTRNAYRAVDSVAESLTVLTETFDSSVRIIDRSNGLHSLYTPMESTSLTRALSNLTRNAIEAQGEGIDKAIVVSLRNSARYLDITVRDSGPGIPKDILDALKAGGVMSRKTGGHGLGLRSTISLVVDVAGSIKFHSRPGKGTEVTLRVPLLHHA